MSPARPASAKTMNRRYLETARQLDRSAASARYAPALRLCLAEIEQFHSTAYPDCAGGCPAHEAMSAARVALR